MELKLEKIPQAARLCDQMDITRQMVDIGDCQLYCEIEGNGIPLVLINGGPGGTHHFFHPWFSALRNEFQIIYYDQRGCGLSDYQPGAGYSFEQAVDDLEKLRKKLKIEKWLVLGFSFGGGLAQYYSIKYPESVLGQILVASIPMLAEIPTTPRENEVFTAEELQIREQINQAVGQGKITIGEMFYNLDLHNGWKLMNNHQPETMRMIQAARYDIVFDQNFSSDFYKYEFTGCFRTCPLPTLLIESKNDVLWAPGKAEKFKINHPNAQMILYETARHCIYQDEPVKFFTDLSSWVQQIKAPSSTQIAQWKTEVENLRLK